MIYMKTLWRVGIDKAIKTKPVTSGIYRLSRNPAFVGMDMMFLGISVTYLNIITILAALLILIGIHLQIFQEEKHMIETFGKNYIKYSKDTPRYILL